MTEKPRITTYEELKEQFYNRIDWFVEHYPPLNTLVNERIAKLENPGIKEYDIIDVEDYNYIVCNVIDMIFNNYDFPNQIITNSVSEESLKFSKEILAELNETADESRVNEILAKRAFLYELSKTDFGKINVKIDNVIDRHFQFNTNLSGVIEFSARYSYELKKSLTPEQLQEFVSYCGELEGLDGDYARQKVFDAYSKWIPNKQEFIVDIIRNTLKTCFEVIDDEFIKQELVKYILRISDQTIEELGSKYEFEELITIYSELLWSKVSNDKLSNDNVVGAVTLNTLIVKSQEIISGASWS